MIPGRSLTVLVALVGIACWANWAAVRRPPLGHALRVLLVIGWAASVAGLVYSELPFQKLLLHDLREESSVQKLHVQPVPFETIYRAFAGGESTRLAQVFANGLLLAPTGALIAGLVRPARRTARFGLALGIAIAAWIEGSQFVANLAYGFRWKIVDVDDLVLNATGFWIAWMLSSRASTHEAEPTPKPLTASMT